LQFVEMMVPTSDTGGNHGLNGFTLVGRHNLYF
jgi:hypothetical protein